MFFRHSLATEPNNFKWQFHPPLCYSVVDSSLFGANILCKTLFSKTSWPFSFFRVSSNVQPREYPYPLVGISQSFRLRYWQSMSGLLIEEGGCKEQTNLDFHGSQSLLVQPGNNSGNQVYVGKLMKN